MSRAKGMEAVSLPSGSQSVTDSTANERKLSDREAEPLACLEETFAARRKSLVDRGSGAGAT